MFGDRTFQIVRDEISTFLMEFFGKVSDIKDKVSGNFILQKLA